MEFLQHGAKLGGDALRQEDRDARAEAEKFHVRNGPQLTQEVFQLFVVEQQGIAAA